MSELEKSHRCKSTPATTYRLRCITYRLWWPRSAVHLPEPRGRNHKRHKRHKIGKLSCCTAKAFPVQQTILLYGRIISRTANDFAAQQNHFPYSKRLCCTAESFPVQQTT